MEVDQDNKQKDIEKLDIELPVLAPRIYREYKNLNDLDVTALPHKRVALKSFTAEQQREIVFRDINTDAESHTTVMDTAFEPNYQNVVGFFARSIMRDLRLVGGFDVLFGKIKAFIETELIRQADRPRRPQRAAKPVGAGGDAHPRRNLQGRGSTR